MAAYSGTTRLTMSRDAVEGSPGAKFLRAVQQAVAADYEVLGELGRRGRTIVYLAREAKTGSLVALRLQPAPGASETSGDFTLDVVRQLDGTVPAAKVTCPRCSRVLESFGRYCSQCGLDLAGVAPQSPDELLAAVKEAARGRFDVLGKIPRVEGGGVVYFAREIEGGRLVALRLQKEGGAPGAPGRYVLDRTQFIRSVAEELGVVYGETGIPQKTEQASAEPAIPKDSERVGVNSAPPVADAPPRAPTPIADDSHRVPVWNERTIALAVAGALLLIMVTFAIGRRSNGASTGTNTSASSDSGSTVRLSGGTVKPDSAEVRIANVLPTSAALSVDGVAAIGQRVRVAAGAHRLRLTAPGYVTVDQQVTLEAGERLAWAPQFTRAPSVQRAKPRPTPNARADNAGQGAAASPAPAQSCVSLFDKRDWSRALATCQTEAGTGNTSSQLLLGLMYDRGLGVDRDASAAVQWYTKAADAGHRVAAYRVGVLRREGAPGVPRDEGAAFRWFEQSARLGEPDAELALAEAYFRGKGVRQNKTEGVVWYRTAADHGLAEAQYQLGQLYARGDAVVKSDPTAVTWFQRAAAQGHSAAVDELARRGIKP